VARAVRPEQMTDFNIFTFNASSSRHSAAVAKLGDRVAEIFSNVSAMDSSPDHVVMARFMDETIGGKFRIGPATEVRCWFPSGQHEQLNFVAGNPGDWAVSIAT